MEEVWKTTTVNADYEVSNLGNIRSVKKGITRLLKPFPTGCRKKHDRGRYVSVRLHTEGESHIYVVHRLVAMAFIPNPNNLPQVNHINGIRDDNRVENLEWCNNSYNIWHSYNVLENTNGQNKAVVQYTIDGVLVSEYDSISEASRVTNIGASSIAEVCIKKGCRKTAGDFIWRYKGDEDITIEYNKKNPVVQISKYGEFVKRFPSIREAALDSNISEGSISGVCMKRSRGYNYANGYIWRYAQEYDEREFGYYVDKTFIQMSLNNIFIAEYKGTHELVDKGGFELIKVIRCCNGKNKSTNGFNWCIKEECVLTRASKKERAVVQLDKNMKFVNEFPNSVAASRLVGTPYTNITRCCKYGLSTSAAGFRWLYKDDYLNLIEKE